MVDKAFKAKKMFEKSNPMGKALFSILSLVTNGWKSYYLVPLLKDLAYLRNRSLIAVD